VTTSDDDDPYADRKTVSFEQTEGAAPLPTQLKLKEISQKLRARLWNVIYTHFDQATEYSSMGGEPYFRGPWKGILEYMHVDRDHAMADEFENDARQLTLKVKQIFEKGDYVAIFGWLQYVLRLNTCPYELAGEIERELRIGVLRIACLIEIRSCPSVLKQNLKRSRRPLLISRLPNFVALAIIFGRPQKN
jgi:hypothetical protein